MNQYFLSKGEELSTLRLGKILNRFQTVELPRLIKLRKYYDGIQAIRSKTPTDIGKPCNKVVVNYCNNIVQNYAGYIGGIPIQYASDEEIDPIIDCLKYNDVHNEDNELLRQALIFGRSFELTYIDEDAQVRFKTLDSRECIPVYDDTLNQNLIYVVRFYETDFVEEIQPTYTVEVYGEHSIRTYKSSPGFSSFTLIEEVPHFFSQCPVTVFSLNEDESSIFEQVIDLQDAYNELVSGSIDNFDAFCDAYLILKNCVATAEDLVAMKQNRCLMLDADADASYLTKNITDTQINEMLDLINEQIHKIALSPDFSDEKFMAQSGIAMRFKLVGFENNSSSIEAHMRKALQRRIELISEILAMKQGDSIWRDINISFTRNLPLNIDEIANTINTLRGVVSQRTLLSLVPFIRNVDDEIKAVEEENKKSLNYYLYTDTEDDE